MPPKKSKSSSKTKRATPVSALTKVTSVKHKDKRVNIPTQELGKFVDADEQKPKLVLYPRDPSLDPQLVWKGKDEQDHQPLAVPSVPVYIQEKIHPQAIIDNVRAEAQKNVPQQAMLFSDFNGLPFNEQIDFYHHENKWSNRMILGDSLLVLNSLAEKEGLKGQVQTIYIDPPYGIRFGSNWQVSTRKRNVLDGKAEDATRQPEQVKAFRDTWELGIHSYLAYMRDRLVLAQQLLTESGSVFVQIGDENVHLVRSLLDEVFGSENAISQILYRRGGFQTSEALPNTFDFILWYSKNKGSLKFRPLYLTTPIEGWFENQQVWIEFPDGSRKEYSPGIQISTEARLHSHRAAYSASGGETAVFEVALEGKRFMPPAGRGWSTNQSGFSRIKSANRLLGLGKSLRFKPYFEDFPYRVLTNGWTDTVTSGFSDDKIYVVQTATTIVQRCLLMTTDPGDLVLDPTCGSGTTAYVAELWGRRWITVDTSRVALALARTRLMSARYPYYLLADSLEGARKEAEITGSVSFNERDGSTVKSDSDIKKGFVYKRVPHITLKSIANNEQIDSIHANWQPQLEEIRAKLNQSCKQSWDEWEIPRQPEDKWSDKAKELHSEWWELRRERQKEIDNSIAKRADVELLYDQPYEDNKRIRVAGPFTVESLSPHRVLSGSEDRPASEHAARRDADAGQFETMILDNLKKAGVQNARVNERLKFDRLEPYAGEWIHAVGEYTDKGGKAIRVAVTVGPEHGTVGPDLIKEAAKEALKGLGFELLIVCGFAFDAFAGETAKEFTPDLPRRREEYATARETRLGKLPVLLARMNPDLAMGDELLKKTGAGNLFMVFGEPDIEVKKLKDDKFTVKIKGLDVYDPTTGAIRSSSTDDIACWFIDTDYNEESFFVRHAYFTGADEPYEKLQRALRAEVNEDAWQALYSTSSLPFDKPRTGKIAVKVINHYGDEVLKVYQIS